MATHEQTIPPGANSSTTSPAPSPLLVALRRFSRQPFVHRLAVAFRGLLFPRGMVGATLYAVFVSLLLLVQRTLRLRRSITPMATPQSWSFTLSLLVHVVSFLMTSSDLHRIRWIMSVAELPFRLSIAARGFKTSTIRHKPRHSLSPTASSTIAARVTQPLPSPTVPPTPALKLRSWTTRGVWIVPKTTIAPRTLDTHHHGQSWDAENTLVVFWIHGGGFAVGSPLSLSSGHMPIMSEFDRMAKQQQDASAGCQKAIYYSADYPLAPEAKFPEILHAVVSQYLWLVNDIGAKHVVIGGDSAGGNLTWNVYKHLRELVQQAGASGEHASLTMPLGLMLVSPWMDLTFTRTPMHIVRSYERSSDILTMDFLSACVAGIVTDGVDLRDISLIHGMSDNRGLIGGGSGAQRTMEELPSLSLPRGGCLVVYSGGEMFAPDIEDWIQMMRDTDSNVETLCLPGMPHDFMGAFHDLPIPEQTHAHACAKTMASYLFKCSQH